MAKFCRKKIMFVLREFDVLRHVSLHVKGEVVAAGEASVANLNTRSCLTGHSVSFQLSSFQKGGNIFREKYIFCFCKN